MYGTPASGYEARAVFGPHTLELRGMPMGRTPEYMQERLRRFFAKSAGPPGVGVCGRYSNVPVEIDVSTCGRLGVFG